ncbi:hypothetical protein B5F91_12295 [Bacteroides sp. An322]|nr:hypothetical protein B5F91_12295 [Bacteroides sp. An322]
MHMKKLKIHIEELGPIRNADIELAPIMIFTGASNLGKSYTNFLAYYVFYLFSSNRLLEFFQTKVTERMENGKSFSFSFNCKELTTWMETDARNFFIYLLNYPNVPCKVNFYFEGNPTFNIQIKEAQNPRISFGEGSELQLTSVTINGTTKNIFSNRNDILKDLTPFIATQVEMILLDTQIRHAYLLPPGRASLLNESFSIKKEVSNTGMYDIFLNDFDFINNWRMRENPARKNNRLDNTINQISKRIIDGKLESNKDGITLKINGQEDQTVPISAAASSIKELSPLLLWAETGYIENDSLCIEEPEAHAHPEMQYKIADLLAACAMKGTFMQITTHSDYLLARLNQLIRLHTLKTQDSSNFEKLCNDNNINRELTLDKDLINAYYFQKDETSHQIIIRKLNTDKGIPFETFANAVQEQIDWNQIFDEQDDENL